MRADLRHRIAPWLLGAFAVGLAVSISVSEAALAALALFVLIAPTARRRLVWPLVWPVCAFALVTFVSAATSATPLESLTTAKDVVLLGTVWIIAAALADARAARRFLCVLFGAVSLVAVVAITQVALCHAGGPDLPLLGRFLGRCARARGFFSIYMTLAGILMVLLVARLPQLIAIGTRAAGSWAMWLLNAVALGLTYVRGAWLGFVMGVAACLLASRRRTVGMLALAAVIGLLVVSLPGVLGRARTIGNPADATTADRLGMLRAGLRMAAARPVLGLGVGQVKRQYPSYAQPDALLRTSSHLHNTPLQILVERGVLGLVAWLLIWVEFFARGIRIAARPAHARGERALVMGSVCAVGAFLFAGLFEYNFGDSEVLLVVLSLVAVPFVVDRDRVLAYARPVPPGRTAEGPALERPLPPCRDRAVSE